MSTDETGYTAAETRHQRPPRPQQRTAAAHRSSRSRTCPSTTGSLKAVDGLNLDLRAGETVALLGPNGAGKSTSLDMLLALRKPTSGKIEMFGSDPYHAVKSGRVGAMLQSGGLMPEVTVRELVTLVTGLHPRPEPVEITLKRAGIAQFADQRVDRLSGGQTQRVRFALAICGQSELIVLDEPTTAMDVETRRLFWDSMKDEVAQGRTLLFATHYLEEADQAADRILVINRGRLLADGTPAEIKARAGAKRISFRLDQVDEQFLLGLPAPGEPGGQARLRADPVQRLGPHAVRHPGRRLPAARAWRSPAWAWNRPSWPSPPKTTGPTGPKRRRTDMAGTLALTKAELSRLLHNKRYFIFTVAFPVVLYLLVGRQITSQAYGVSFGAYYMVSMATFGAFSGALNGNSQRISQEKKDGWIRQLRLTPLPANGYVISKILVSMATTVPSIVIVLLLGRFYGNVHLPAWEWPVIAVVVWFGSTIFAALAVAVGYRFAPEQVQPITLTIYFIFAILGGLWFPLSGVLGISASSPRPTRR